MGKGRGGDYYDDGDRGAWQPAAAGGGGAAAPGFSLQADQLLRGNKSLHADLDPTGKQLCAPEGTDPIVIAVDVTGSMGDWSKIMYDKLPMFFGQLVMQGYVQNPAISFAGVGDAYTDTAPLQVGKFAQGAGIDAVISKLFLEGGGGGQNYETYELAAYFYARRCLLGLPEGRRGYMFFTGDEGFYPAVNEGHIRKWVGEEAGGDVPTSQVLRELRQKYHVFLLHKTFFDVETNAKLVAQWQEELGESRVLEVPEAKAVVDVMLGAIALVSGTRTLEEYAVDLRDKGQGEHRVEVVTDALRGLAETPHPQSPTASRLQREMATKAITEGSAEAVAEWLLTLGLGKDYTHEITSNGVDGPVLRSVSEQDLKEIGIQSFGDRRKIKLALDKLLAA
eukprot:TRINITY_DN17183_c0_g1_i2.p1 TRINITY_DN17183_c0_g1~~TRINITY_DN17183_c0_g1_i2.p1  ORF type:complete len:424 (+),score=118.30 TRINITY_DN17183_c0_g1_i2:96-1274(+)